jgi:hypothetical protein
MDWTPIDLAEEEYANGGCCPDANPFYEIRNLFYQHFLFLRNELSFDSVPAELPPRDTSFAKADEVTQFFINHTSRIKFEEPSYPMKPSMYVPTAFELFSQEMQKILLAEEEEEEAKPKSDETDPSKSVNDYNTRQIETNTRWGVLSAEEKQVIMHASVKSGIYIINALLLGVRK